MSLRKKLEITSISASNIRDAGSENCRMQVYAKVSFGRRKIKKTATCSETNPAWNFSLSFSNIKESEVNQEVAIKLYCKRACFEKDEYIGEVNNSLSKLLQQREENNQRDMPELPLKRGDVTTGKLRFSYNFENQPDKERTCTKILIAACGQVIGTAICCACCGGV